MKNADLLLVSYDLCPYVQRSIIMLTEKNIDYDRKYIDLSNPSKWFLQKSPLGKVPLLIVDKKHVIFESAVICEFLDEISPNTLHPVDPIVKAKHRAWIEYGSQILDDIGGLYNCSTISSFEHKMEVIYEKFQRLESTIETPFFSGTEFRMIDAVYATIFRYFDVMDRFLPFDIFKTSPKVQVWRSCLAKRKSVISAVKPEYPELLLNFFRKRNSHISTLISKHQQTSVSV